MTTVQADDRGAICIPPELLREIGIQPRQPVLVEKMGRFIRIYGADEEVEVYTPERKAEFLLNSAVDEVDYAEAVKAVRGLGIDPEAIPHVRPSGV